MSGIRVFQAPALKTPMRAGSGAPPTCPSPHSRAEGDPTGRVRSDILCLLPAAYCLLPHSPRRPRPTERASMAVICPSLLAKLAASRAVT